MEENGDLSHFPFLGICPGRRVHLRYTSYSAQNDQTYTHSHTYTSPPILAEPQRLDFILFRRRNKKIMAKPARRSLSWLSPSPPRTHHHHRWDGKLGLRSENQMTHVTPSAEPPPKPPPHETSIGGRWVRVCGRMAERKEEGK